jgi:hypothetical protein
MTDLNSNTLWQDVKAGNVTSLKDRLLGPTFNYAENIRSPRDLGVGSAGNIGQVFTNARAVGGYVDQLIRQPLLGNQTFVQTGGMCKAPNGKVVPRWSWVDNRLGGSDALTPGMARSLGGVTDQFNGIIPGMFGDISALNPARLMSALTLNGVPDCEAYTCPVTTSTGVPSGTDTKFMVAQLEPHVNKCSVSKIEAFSCMAPFIEQPHVPRKLTPSYVTEYVLLGAAILGMFLLAQKHAFR